MSQTERELLRFDGYRCKCGQWQTLSRHLTDLANAISYGRVEQISIDDDDGGDHYRRRPLDVVPVRGRRRSRSPPSRRTSSRYDSFYDKYAKTRVVHSNRKPISHPPRRRRTPTPPPRYTTNTNKPQITTRRKSPPPTKKAPSPPRRQEQPRRQRNVSPKPRHAPSVESVVVTPDEDPISIKQEPPSPINIKQEPVSPAREEQRTPSPER